MRKVGYLFGLGLGMALGGFLLAYGSTAGGGEVVQDDLHRHMMSFAVVITIIGEFTMFAAIIARGDRTRG